VKKLLSLIIFLPFSLLAVILVGMGMYEIAAPMIPLGPLGMILIGVILLVILSWLGVKKLSWD